MFSFNCKVNSGFLLLLFSFSIIYGFSQTKNNLNFSSWSKENGLPSNVINAIEKDKLGFLWIGTNDGLCRYDGPNSLKIYRQAEKGDSITNSLQSNDIRSLFCDSKGYLWIGTRHGGLTNFNPSTNKWVTFQHNPQQKNSLSNNEVLTIIEDSKQRIWVGTENGLNVFDRTTKTFTQFKLDETDANVTTARAVLSIMEDDKGWIWAGTWAGGLHLLLEDENGNYNGKKIKHFQTTKDRAANNVWVLHQDINGRYWLGLHGGGVLLMKIPQNATNKVGDKNWQPDFHPFILKVKESQSSGCNIVLSILQDQYKNLWIGTAHGLFKVNHKFLSAGNNEQELLKTYDFFLPSDDERTLIGSNIQDLYEDDQGLIWIATVNGLSQFNRYSNQFKSLNFSDEYFKMPHSPCLVVDLKKNIWVGMLSSGVVKYQIKNGILKKTDDSINNLILGERVRIIYSPDGIWLYVGTELGITAINLKTRKTKKYPIPQWVQSKIKDLYIYTIMVDNRGFIWFGTALGLFRINHQTKEFTLFEPDKTKPNAISGYSVKHIIEDSKGVIWIATHKGLNKIVDSTADDLIFQKFFFNKKDPKKGPINNQIVYLKEVDNYLFIGTEAGICAYNFLTNEFESSNTTNYNYLIKSIEEGLNNDIWVSTGEGIFNYNYKNKSYRVFNKKDGLNNTAYRHGSSFKDINHNIYFVYTNGFNYFSPATFLSNETPPPVYISDIEITSRKGRRQVNGIYENEIELNYDDYRLSINYAALNYNRADKNKFKHRLVGFETQWNDIKFGSPIIYTSLKTNEYRLEVKAANNDGVWNNGGHTITIIKHPPYWETWWFRLLAVLLVLASIFLFFWWYTANIKNRNEQLKVEIANRKKVEQKLQDYNAELKQSNKYLEQFAYITSHDLKEPLRVILSFSDLLSKKYGNKLDEKGTIFINIIDDSVRRMGSLIDSLLTYSIVGQKDSVYETVDLDKLLKDKISDLSQLIKEKNATVKIETLPEIVGEKEQIGMVFYNLINNAIKFNKQKKPTVLIKEEVSNIDYWKFSIKDNGIGIEPKYKEQIFGIFKRLHNKSDYVGTGIGLSLCQKIIQQHKGEIWFQSSPGEGTTFFFTIKKNLL